MRTQSIMKVLLDLSSAHIRKGTSLFWPLDGQWKSVRINAQFAVFCLVSTINLVLSNCRGYRDAAASSHDDLDCAADVLWRGMMDTMSKPARHKLIYLCAGPTSMAISNQGVVNGMLGVPWYGTEPSYKLAHVTQMSLQMCPHASEVIINILKPHQNFKLLAKYHSSI